MARRYPGLVPIAILAMAACGGATAKTGSDGGTRDATHVSASSSGSRPPSSSSTSTGLSSSSSSTESSSSSASQTGSATSGSSSSGASSSSSETASTSTSPAKDWGLGDVGSMCAPPDGGLPCTPGVVDCGGAPCDLSTGTCTSYGPEWACYQQGVVGAGYPGPSCDEAADCAADEVCCLAGSNVPGLSCQKLNATNECPSTFTYGGPPQPAIAYAQVCRSDNECPSGKCAIWNCSGGGAGWLADAGTYLHYPEDAFEACSNPVPSRPTLCTAP